MTNIWTQTFEEVRKPFFEMEDPYTLREKKEKEEEDDDDKPKRWWDDDGDGVGYEKGEVDGKFKKKKVKEEVEEIGEGLGGARNASDEKRVQARLDDIDARSDAGLEALKSGTTRWQKQRKADQAQQFLRSHPRRKSSAKNEEYDVNEWAETLTEVDRTRENERKLDVRKGIKNKVVVGPSIREEVEEWISELVEEGHDLSQFTLDEMVEIYESADLHEGSADMPSRGDAETVNTTDQRQLAAKRRMAQAQIRADMARVQFQKAAATAESFDAIVDYLSQRPDAFKNLEEGVFDPKKSKLRPAAERSKNAITDAQRKAAAKEAQRVADIHSRGETALAGLRPSRRTGSVQTTPPEKPPAPEANREVKGRYDKLAAAANKVLKDAQK